MKPEFPQFPSGFGYKIGEPLRQRAAYDAVLNFHIAVRSARTANLDVSHVTQTAPELAIYSNDMASRVMRMFDAINPVVSNGPILMPLGYLEIPLNGVEARRKVAVFLSPPLEGKTRPEWHEEKSWIVLHLPQYEMNYQCDEVIDDPVHNDLVRECYHIYMGHMRHEFPFMAKGGLKADHKQAVQAYLCSAEEFEAECCVIGNSVRIAMRFGPIEVDKITAWLAKIDIPHEPPPRSLYHSWEHIDAWLNDSALRPVFIQRVENELLAQSEGPPIHYDESGRICVEK